MGLKIGYEFEPAAYNTLAGLIYHHLGRVAQAGDGVALPELEIIVEATDGHRLIEVCLKRIEESSDTETPPEL